MTEVDASIPLQTKPAQIDLASIYGAAMQLRQMRDDAQFNNSLKTILSGQPAIKPDGTVDANTLAQISRLGPKGLEYASKISTQASETQERQAQTAHANSETQKDQQAADRDFLSGAVADYDSAVKSGNTSPDIALTSLKKAAHDHIYASYPQEKADQIWAAFSPLDGVGIRNAAMTGQQRMEAAKASQEGFGLYQSGATGARYRYNPRTAEITNEDGTPIKGAAPTDLSPIATSYQAAELGVKKQEVTDAEHKEKVAESDKGWGVYTDGNGKLVRVNVDTGEVRGTGEDANKVIADPGPLTKVGTDSARSPQVMVMQQFKRDFEAKEGRPPNAQELTDETMSLGEKTAAAKAFGTGAQGSQVRSINVAVQHLQLVRDYAHALENNDIQAINRLKNTWLSEFGSPAPTNLDAVAQTAGQEVTKAVVPGAGAESERAEAGKRFASYRSNAQFDGAIDASIGLMSGQLTGLRQQYKTSTGHDDFLSLVTPEAKAAIYGKGINGLPEATQEQWAQLPEDKREIAKARLSKAGYDVSELH